MKHLPSVKNMMYFALLLGAVALSIFLHAYWWNALCLNEDEAAQGYNTYSVLTTGYDEYGRIPLRFLSFGENKLPLTGMLSSFFIALLGLGDVAVRLPVLILGSLMPLFFYGAVFTLTKSKLTGIFAALFAGTNMWLLTMSRHQHEAVILVVIVLLVVRRIYQKHHEDVDFIRFVLGMGALLFMGLYSYHSAKVVVPILAGFWIMQFRTQKKYLRYAVAGVFIAFGIFALTELIQPNNRVANLSYFTSPVFIHEIEEGRRTGGSSLYYNKLVFGAHKLFERSAHYISPSFLLLNSDPNPRYGSPQVPLLTLVDYVLAGIGLAVIWFRKQPWRYLLTALLVAGALPAALALPEGSSTRSFVIIVPLLTLASIAIYELTRLMHTRKFVVRMVIIGSMVCIAGAHVFQFSTASYQYFTNYLRSPATAGAWQCGAKEMAEYVWTRYDDFKHIHITNAYGQPYIFLLFYGSYPPAWYQKEARVGAYNEYGFWEHSGFDKFVFEKPLQVNDTSDTLFIMTPDEAVSNNLDTNQLHPIYDKNRFLRYYASE